MIIFEKLPIDILSRIAEVEKFLLQEDNIIFAYLFGGFAKGSGSPLSDIDIAIYVRDSKNLAECKLELFNKIGNILGTGELDLIILNTAPVSIAGRMLQNKKVLVDKEPFRRHIYESVTLREFFDFKIKEGALFKGKYGIG